MVKTTNRLIKHAMASDVCGTRIVKGTANSEVVTYSLSEDELAKYRALPKPVRVTNKTKIW